MGLIVVSFLSLKFFLSLYGLHLSKASLFETEPLRTWWQDGNDVNSPNYTEIVYPRRIFVQDENDSSAFLYKISAREREIELALRQRDNLLAPSFLIQTLRDDETQMAKADVVAAVGCHLHGIARSHPAFEKGSAAVSVCDGNLTGAFVLGDFEMSIEPLLENNSPFRNGTYPHLLRKRLGLKQDDNGRYRRQSRQCPTREFDVETAVFVGPLVSKKYARLSRMELTAYILSFFNIANLLFDHCAIGYNVYFSIVRLTFLEKWPTTLTYTRQSKELLERFCNWQTTINPHKAHPSHYDYAILITGEILLSDNGKGLQPGRAYVGEMCGNRYSCHVAAETGFRTGFVIAHEAGHSFGALHDGDNNGCNASAGYLMSAYVRGGQNLYVWSSCSLRNIRDWMEEKSTKSDFCLLDSHDDRNETYDLIGEQYSLDDQCVFQTGRKDSKACIGIVVAGGDNCSALWCSDSGGVCTTLHVPAGDGSPCGPGMICLRGYCRPKSERDAFLRPGAPVDGKWGEWSEFGSCSRSCDTGIRRRNRQCNNPRPRHGGKLCEGSWYDLELCNQQKCPSESYWLKTSCAKYFDASRNPLLPFFIKGSCELACYNALARYAMNVFDGKRLVAPDGVSCDISDNRYCYQGRCLKIGCSYDEKCGICDGREDMCTAVKRNLAATISPKGKVFIGLIPPGARKVIIHLLKGLLRLSLVVQTDNNILLNSSSVTYRDGRYYRIDGDNFESKIHLFRNIAGHETVEIFGSLKEWLEVWIENPLIEAVRVRVIINFADPKECADINACLVDGQWTEWQSVQSCSRSCGGGIASWKRTCTNPRPGRHGRPCEGPDVKHELCNNEPCPRCTNFFNLQCVREKGDERYIALGRRDGLERCYILCFLPNTGLAQYVAAEDGTRCNFTSTGDGRCRNGECLPLGCDGIVGSSAVPDRCGQCNGNGTSCVDVDGQYKVPNILSGSYDIVTVPAGARNFTLTIDLPLGASVYIVLRDAKNGCLLYSAESVVTYRKSIDYAFDAEVTFFRLSSQQMSLEIAGDIPFSFIVEMVITDHPYDRIFSPFSTYSFSATLSVFHTFKAINSEFAWSWEKGPCDRTCGNTGKYQYVPHCYSRRNGTAVSDSLCASPRPSIRLIGWCWGLPPCPPTLVPTTRLPTTPATPTIKCPKFRWSFQARQCSVTCGNGYQRYSAICTDECTGKKRGLVKCSTLAEPRPQSYRKQCFAGPCEQR